MSDATPAATPTTTNRCIFCGKDCSFLALTEGCCLHCGDAWMADPVKAIRALAGTVTALETIARMIDLALATNGDSREVIIEEIDKHLKEFQAKMKAVK